jgi:hypothetical protein
MKSSKFYAIITTITIFAALASSFYYSQSPQPYHFKSVRFCPQTANAVKRFGKKKAKESQEKLDRKYCDYSYKLLAEVWNKKRFEDSRSLPESSLIVNDIYPENNSLWFLVAPIFAGISYLSYAAKTEQDEVSAHEELENFKTCIKLQSQEYRTSRETGVYDSEKEREFKQEIISQKWDSLRVKTGLISIPELQRQADKEQELQDIHHATIKKQIAVSNSEMDKAIAENTRDKHKADKESQKILGKKSDEYETSNNPDSYIQERVNQLIEALQRWEDGWLYTIIKNNKPLWLIGSQGSGKTNTAGCIALIRKYCLEAPIYQLIDRHATGENWKVWQLLDAQIKAESEEEIGQALEDACARWLVRIKEVPKQKQQLIIDEFTNLKKIPSCKEAAMKFFSMHLTDTRKAKEYFIGINHYFTNESTVEGTFEARKAGTIQIKKFSANGETPLPRVQIVHGLVDSNGNELEEVEGTLPNWFEAVQIYNHFNGKPINFEG